MAYSAQDYLALLQGLLPRGPVWPREATSVQTQLLATLMPTWATLAGRDANLLVDGFPSTTLELLPEWELSVGLPDPCAGEAPTIEARRNQVVARFAGLGGQSVPYFIQFAANLGYPITVTEFAPFRFGHPFGQPLYGLAWAFAWQVNAPTYTVDYFRFGESAMGEPFASFGNTVLQCELQRLKPAHTTLLFNYT